MSSDSALGMVYVECIQQYRSNTSSGTSFVWIQSIGFPTYCFEVTMTEKVKRITDEMHQCKRKTAESVWMWLTRTNDFRRRKISNILTLKPEHEHFILHMYFTIYSCHFHLSLTLNLINHCRDHSKTKKPKIRFFNPPAQGHIYESQRSSRYWDWKTLREHP